MNGITVHVYVICAACYEVSKLNATLRWNTKNSIDRPSR